jgi:hypothetical protein
MGDRLSQRLVCPCCNWRWPTEERFDDHILYMQVLESFDFELLNTVDNEEDDLS